MKQFSLYNYNFDSFFNHYFKHDPDGSEPAWPEGQHPEIIISKIKPLMPPHIDTIINFGCANGRDFIPFHDDYNCVGFDLAPLDHIDWVCKTKNLTYYQCSIEDLMGHTPDRSKFPPDLRDLLQDLSTSLVYTNGTLMYVSPLNQDKFISYLLENGCRNMVFQEYPPSSGYVQFGVPKKFNPNKKYLELFDTKSYREGLTAFIYLEK